MIGGLEDMEGNRRKYSEEFKKEAVQYSLTSEKTVAEVAHDLGIAHSNLTGDGVLNIAKMRS